MKAARATPSNELPTKTPFDEAPPVEDSIPLEVDAGPETVLVLEEPVVALTPPVG